MISNDVPATLSAYFGKYQELIMVQITNKPLTQKNNEKRKIYFFVMTSSFCFFILVISLTVVC